MRKMFLFLLCAGFYLVGVAQGDFYNPIQGVAKIPQSPEVAAFDKFTNSVNMYTGVPTIALPLYTFEGRELNLPISLSYDASGIKVDQIATHVGLGWSLNYGGVISRNVYAFPDDYVGGSLIHPQYKIWDSQYTQKWIADIALAQKIHGNHSGTGTATSAYNFYNNYFKNKVDYQPDTFSVSVNGLSGTIFVDYKDTSGPGSYKAYFLEDPLVEVVYLMGDGTGGGFTITDSSGTVYSFEQFEITFQYHWASGQFAEDYRTNYISAWFLTEMVSPNGLDTFTFSYETDLWDTPEERSPLQEKGLDLDSNCNYTAPLSTYNRNVTDYERDQVRLSSISYTSKGGTAKVILSVESEDDRDDLDNDVERIAGLRMYDRIHPSTSGNEVLKVDFDNEDSYFGNTSLSRYNIRLKLDGIKLYRDNPNDAKTYVFEYFQPSSVPPRLGTKAIDYWGYFNGRYGNTELIPNPSGEYNSEIANFEAALGNFSEFGSDRRPYLSSAQIGTLSSITYPTGGKTTYVYEEHRDTNRKQVGGLRLRNTITSTEDPETGEDLSYLTFYYYGDLKAAVDNGLTLDEPSDLPDAEDYDSSGIAQQDVIFCESKIIEVNNGITPSPCTQKKSVVTQNLAVDVPNDITYSTVSEIRFNNGAFDGCTITDFFNGPYLYGFGKADEQQPFQNVDLHYGNVKMQRTYNSSFDLLQKSETQMSTMTLSTTTNVGLRIFPNGGPGGTSGGSQACRNYTSSIFFLTQSNTSGGLTYCPSGFSIYGYFSPFYHYYFVPSYTYLQLWVKQTSSTTTRYEGGLTQTVTTTNTYGSSNHYLPTETATLDSRVGLRKVKTVYNVDYADLPVGYPNTTVLQDMVSRNELLVPVERIEYYAEVLLPSPVFEETSRQWLEYKDFDTGAGLEIRPYQVYVSKDGDNPELRMVYSFYDNNGQLAEIHYPQNDAPRYSYIWGYKGDYLLAEIKNLRYGTLLLDETLNSSLSTLLATSNNATATEDDVRDDLEDFRTLVEAAYPNCLMTGYVHEPGVGVKSVSDTRGYTTYYYYDQHNRLWYATDQDGKVLSLNDYNLREN